MSTEHDPDNSDTPVLLINSSGVIEQANSAAQKLFGRCVGRSCMGTVRPRDEQGNIVCKGGCPRGDRNRSVKWSEVQTHERVGDLECSALGDNVVVALRRFTPTPQHLQKLTPRERQVLALVADGMNTTAIAVELGISRSTARTHVERCRIKLGARSQAEAVVRAFQSHQLTL